MSKPAHTRRSPRPRARHLARDLAWALAGAAALASSSRSAAASTQGRPLPLAESVTLKEDGAVWTVEGRQRLPAGVVLTSLRAGRIVGRGTDAVLEIAGTLDLRAVTGGEMVLENVTLEPSPECGGVSLLNCRFQGRGGLRGAAAGPTSAEILVSSSRFTGAATLDLTIAGGKVSILSSGFASPVRVRGAPAPEGQGQARGQGQGQGRGDPSAARARFVAVGCHGTDQGLLAGLRLERLPDVLLRNVDVAGDECAFVDCRKLALEGDQLRATRVELRQTAAGSFGGTTISQTDFRCKSLDLAQPRSDEPQELTFERCWFDGRVEPQAIRAAMLVDADSDATRGVRARFERTSAQPLLLAGPR